MHEASGRANRLPWLPQHPCGPAADADHAFPGPGGRLPHASPLARLTLRIREDRVPVQIKEELCAVLCSERDYGESATLLRQLGECCVDAGLDTKLALWLCLAAAVWTGRG